MINSGKVIKVDADSILVKVTRKGSCGENCASCNACDNSDVIVQAFSKLSVKQGDFVEFETASLYVYSGLLLVFIAPIVLPLISFLLLAEFGQMLAIIGAVVALVFAVVGVFCVSRCKIYLNKLKPEIIKVINK